MVTMTIDGETVEAAEGTTVLAAARKLGKYIPTMCYVDGCEPYTSCMLCVVEDGKSGRLWPACSARVQNGMEVLTGSDAVREARRDALELLLSDHVGDCEAPCRRVCPATMDIPLMIRQIAARDFRSALITVKRDIALPAVLGRICPAPCEKGCRRRQKDEGLSICLLKPYVADVDLASDDTYRPDCAPSSGKNVAIIGAGPAGLSAAYYLAQRGHACTVYDDHDVPGGQLRYGVPEDDLPRDVLAAETAVIAELGVEFVLNTRVGDTVSFEDVRKQHNAVVLATGSIGPDALAEFGIETTKKGAKITPGTRETSLTGVFAGGAAVSPIKRLAVRACGDGKEIAFSVDQFLGGETVRGEPKRFDSTIRKLQDGEMDHFMLGADARERRDPEGGKTGPGFDATGAVAECARCLHCDCRKPTSCKLRRLADAYGAGQKRYRGGDDRKRFERHDQHADVIYEPGKCIACGLCVQITEREAEPLGLSFVGRGFDVKVSVPFEGTIADGLTRVAADCVAACPTGALSMRDAEERGRGEDR